MYMGIVLYDISWMAFNVSLALIAVIFAWTAYKTTSIVWKSILSFLWLLFIPNTIYMLTDIGHLFEDWHKVGRAYQPLLVLLYTILMIIAVITFFFGMYPVERVLLGGKPRKHEHLASTFMIALNFIIGFGIVLGRIERTNSWEVITNLPKVISDTTQIFFSPVQIILVILTGLACNGIYFGIKHLIVKKKLLGKKLLPAIT